ILAGYLERVLARFNAADLYAARHMLTSLISLDGRRLVLRADDLLSLFDGGEVQADRLLEELVVARVVRRRNQEGESWLELAHDFLTGEVSKWLTGDEVELRRARGVLDRAMENYRAHELTVDSDVLDLLLPFGERLRLAGEEADLLMKSLLLRARLAPGWLIKAAPKAVDLIVEASHSPDPLVRKRAVEAALVIRREELRGLLSRMALWDKDAGVRKSAGIALAEWFPGEVEAMLSHPQEAGQAGAVRRAVSLAIIRDHDKRMVRLSRLPVFVSLLVVAGLAWVRLRRDWREIVREGIGGTLGGASAGLAGGLLLGAGLAASRQSDIVEAVSLSLVLLSLGAAVGAAAGFGVSFGLSAARRITYRHSRWWSVVGGGAGGATVGAVANLIGVDTLRALFGQRPLGMTGAFEGLVIGSAVSLGAVLVDRLVARARPWQTVLGAGLAGLVAGVLLAASGGSLFTASLEILSRSFTDSQLRMDGLASMFGEVQFGRTTKLVLGAIEGLVFGCGVTAGINAIKRAFKKG
ncbi:MAG TPA: HEAT repeat domain-containing protein, partial [Blastocatellia bacterium]|nr:HEAT repeat domain-containing protein [Blastocatellia bacterium]